jgi:L-lactate dehydrogenase (cytochrome)
VEHVDTSTKLLGINTALPIYISPAALARLGHPGGEVNMVHVAGQEGIMQGVSDSRPLSDVSEINLQDK